MARDLSSRAWRPLPLIQRSLTLGLGRFLSEDAQGYCAVDELLSTHRDHILNQLGKPASRRQPQDLLFTLLLIDAILGKGRGRSRESLVGSFYEHFDADGSIRASDPVDELETRETWISALQQVVGLGIGIGAEDLVSIIDRFDHVLHATLPDGRPVEYGERSCIFGRFSDDPEWLYVSTSGREGSAPAELVYQPTSGLICSRSGWGETDRALDEETFYSVLVGSVPVGGHHDSSRVTYFADGVEWLVDPSDDSGEYLAARELHTVISIDGAPPPKKSTSVVVRWHRDEASEDYQISDTSYPQLKQNRHLAYSRKGEYLAVVDVVKNLDRLRVRQNWMVHPEARLEILGNSVLLFRGAKMCSLTFWGHHVTSPTVDDVLNSVGELVARRVSVFTEQADALITGVISRVRDPEQFKVEGVGESRYPVAIRIMDRGIAEQMVLGTERVMIGEVSEDPQAIADRIHLAAVIGTGGRRSTDELRLLVRAYLSAMKDEVWSQGGSRAARSKAIQATLQFAEAEGLDGLRDYEIGAALVDLAADDIRPDIAKHPLVAQKRRSAIINWHGGEMKHSYYKVPIQSHRNVPLEFGNLPTKSIMSLDLGQIVLPIYISDLPGRTLTVMFHGATNRVSNATPRFERLRSTESLGMGPVITFADPCLDLDASMILSWYAGTDAVNLHEVMAEFVARFARERGCSKIVLCGNSGGGFAALQVASFLPGSLAVVFNPQVELDRYAPRLALPAHLNLFGRESVRDDAQLRARMNVLARFAEIGFNQRVVVVQNTGDGHHLIEHFGPLRRAFEGSAHPECFRSVMLDSGPGHRLPPPDEYLRILTASINETWPEG